MSRGVTKPAVMLEQQQAPAAHLTAGGGVVVFEHLLQRLPQQFQVVVGETGLLGQRSADEAVAAVDGVGDGEFANWCFVGLSPLRAAQNVRACSCAITGSTDRPKVICI